MWSFFSDHQLLLLQRGWDGLGGISLCRSGPLAAKPKEK